MSILKEQILQKIIKVEEKKDFFNRAIKAQICPKCGEPLYKHRNEFYDKANVVYYEVELKCTLCRFTHVLYQASHQNNW